MAMGARITSNNLSGKTATVNFVPVYGTTSGSTINLGTKTVPFNNINSHPYGVYSLHFAEYDYTYTLNVPEPVSTGVQFFVHSNRMVESDNYGVATLNFNDLTANIIDLGININDWNNNNIYEITEGGFMYYFTGTNNADEPLTVEHIKSVIKDELEFPFEIVKEEFYYMDEELKDIDTAPFKSGNEFILTIK